MATCWACVRVLLLPLLILISPSLCAARSKFSPQSKAELKTAITTCLDSYMYMYGPIGDWDVIRVKDISDVFMDMSAFNADISKWDVSRVSDMSQSFMGATQFNSDISKWDVSRVTDMESMFADARSFDQSISKWDVSNVTTMKNMFWGATSFDIGISKWDVGRVTDMGAMFMGAGMFEGQISKWNVSRVIDMAYMFSSASEFQSDLSNWQVSLVSDMRAMFMDAKLFNGDISKWNVSSVTNMASMFRGATAFNGGIFVFDMNGVSLRAKSFDGDLSNWDVSKVAAMDNMFRDATSFKQLLTGDAWYFSEATKRDMFLGSAGLIDRNGRVTVTPSSPHAGFAPKSLSELKDALGGCLYVSPQKSTSKRRDVNCIPPAGFTVRPIEEKDMNILQLFDAAMSKELSSTNPEAPQVQPLGRAYLDRVSSPKRTRNRNWRTLVLDFADIPCGFLLYSYEQKRFRFGRKRKNFVRVHFLRVATDQRGRGLSHVLLTEMMKWPSDWKNIQEVNLYVLESNVKAIAIFVNWGFKVTKREVGYLDGHTALKMVKPMDDSIKQPTQIEC